jgi:hypothetical protein
LAMMGAGTGPANVTCCTAGPGHEPAYTRQTRTYRPRGYRTYRPRGYKPPAARPAIPDTPESAAHGKCAKLVFGPLLTKGLPQHNTVAALCVSATPAPGQPVNLDGRHANEISG